MARSLWRRHMAKRHISRERQLFADDWLIDRTANLKRTLHQPVKHERNPLLVADRPWEKQSPARPQGDTLALYGTVLYDADESLFQMWYQMGGQGMCYATSADGLHWEKPALNLLAYEGSRDNNIVYLCLDAEAGHQGRARIDSLNVIKDEPETDPLKRYKGLGWQATTGWPLGPFPVAGLYVSFSPDGLRWTTFPDPVLRHDRDGVGDVTSLMVDRKRHKYVAFTKGGLQIDPWAHLGWKRTRTLSESDDFLHWSTPVEILKADDQDPPDLQPYAMQGWDYESLYLATLGAFDQSRHTIDIQLALSRDGRHWFRGCNRQTFIPTGQPGDWDAYNISCPNSAPIEVGDELWFYYSGCTGAHAFFEDMTPANCAIGLAILRKDGFISLDAGDQEGTLLTKPFTFEGRALLLNADAKSGEMRAEVLDENDEVIPEFSASRCVPIRADSVRQVLDWETGSPWRRVIGRDISMRLYLRNASVYSLWFED